MSNGKVMIILLIVGLIKKTLYKMSQYFPKPHEPFGREINVKVDLSNYAAKTDLKNVTGVDTSKLAANSDLASLKAEIDKIYVDKLKTIPIDLSKLSNVVNNDVVKKAVYDKLVAKVNNLDTRGFALKTKYDIDKSDLQKKISDAGKKISNISGLVKKTDYNAKIAKIESKIPTISGLVTNSALTAVEDKVTGVHNFVKKTYDAKISEIENKYITTADCNKFTKDIVNNKIKIEVSVDKTAISGFINNAALDKKKVATLTAKAELKAKQDKIIKLQELDSSYFRGKSHFEDDGTFYISFSISNNL